MKRTGLDFVNIIRHTLKNTGVLCGDLHVISFEDTHCVMQCIPLNLTAEEKHDVAYIHCVKTTEEKTGVVLGFSLHKEKTTNDFLAVFGVDNGGAIFYKKGNEMKKYGCDENDIPLKDFYNKCIDFKNSSSTRRTSSILDNVDFKLTDKEKASAIEDAQRNKDMILLIEAYKDTKLAHLSALAADILEKDHTADDFLSFQREYVKEDDTSLNNEMWNILQFMLQRISNEDKEKYFFRCWGRQFMSPQQIEGSNKI
jgi:hypothetical protein